MKKYTPGQLAVYAKAFALHKFDSEDKIYDAFKSDLNRRMKRVQVALPLPDELERQSKKLAGKAHEMLSYFREEAIEHKLSPQLKNDAWHPGVELSDYQVHFNELADEMMKGAIAEAHKPLSEAFNAWKKKQRKR